MTILKGKTVVIGVCGGIAAYKAVEVVSRLIKLGADVHVIMTENACRFVTPVTFRTISRNAVVTGMFDEPDSWDIQHISLAEKADLILVVPATANIIGKAASGIADDMLSTVIMAAKSGIMFVPAMNTRMYENHIVQANIAKLRSIGHFFIEPATGALACGTEGKGRLPEPSDIVDAVCGFILNTSKLDKSDTMKGINVLITAGPTREAIDPVRYISNRSSGKMGYAVARAAAYCGAQVVLITGPASSPRPFGPNISIIEVLTADEMHESVMKYYQSCDIIILMAAVADFRPYEVHSGKIKKNNGSGLELKLVSNPDIAEELGQIKGDRVVIGACAETGDLISNAETKLKKKNFDMIMANDVTIEGAGFETDTNIAVLLWADGAQKQLPRMSKDELAGIVVDETMTIYKMKHGTEVNK